MMKMDLPHRDNIADTMPAGIIIDRYPSGSQRPRKVGLFSRILHNSVVGGYGVALPPMGFSGHQCCIFCHLGSRTPQPLGPAPV